MIGLGPFTRSEDRAYMLYRLRRKRRPDLPVLNSDTRLVWTMEALTTRSGRGFIGIGCGFEVEGDMGHAVLGRAPIQRELCGRNHWIDFNTVNAFSAIRV